MDQLLIHTDDISLTLADFLIRFAVSLGIGAIIGLEREHTAMSENIRRFAGIRTFIIVTLLGFLGGMAYFAIGPFVLYSLLASVIILASISYFVTAIKGGIGATTEFTVLIALLLGVFSFLGMIEISISVAVLVVVFLSSKVKLHTIIGKITADELFDFIRFVVVALLVFPFLPDTFIGPYSVINPHEIGIVVLLTSGLGFIAYVMMRIFGQNKGILLGGIIGGMISSTAVTWNFAKKSREHNAVSGNCTVAILAASSVMFLRVMIWTFVFNKALFTEALPALFMVMLSGMGITLYFYLQQGRTGVSNEAIREGKPLDLTGALIFGALYVLILLTVSYTNEQMGNRGLMISSAVSGIADLDAITISVSKLAGTQLSLNIAANALLLAAVANTITKMGIALFMGSTSLRKDLLIAYSLMLVTALLAMLL